MKQSDYLKYLGNYIDHCLAWNKHVIYKLVYLNGNNAAVGENNIKHASSYPMNWTVKN